MNQIIGIIIVVLIIIAAVSVFIRIYNTLILLKFNVEKSFANIDVILKQRAEEIPNLVAIIKEYVTHEKSILTELTGLRTQYLSATNAEEKVKLNNQMATSLGNIMVIAENYPDLKANTSFVKMQERVSQLEDNIADRREFFNESVNMYNIGINEFPNLILSKIINFKEKSLLQISEAEKKYDGVKF